MDNIRQNDTTPYARQDTTSHSLNEIRQRHTLFTGGYDQPPVVQSATGIIEKRLQEYRDVGWKDDTQTLRHIFSDPTYSQLRNQYYQEQEQMRRTAQGARGSSSRPRE